jgi:hypothetical protein
MRYIWWDMLIQLWKTHLCRIRIACGPIITLFYVVINLDCSFGIKWLRSLEQSNNFNCPFRSNGSFFHLCIWSRLFYLWKLNKFILQMFACFVLPFILSNCGQLTYLQPKNNYLYYLFIELLLMAKIKRHQFIFILVLIIWLWGKIS